MSASIFKRGDWVVYVPSHAERDLRHRDCERGTVFVVYGDQLHAKATNAEDLVSAEEYFKSAKAPIYGSRGYRSYLGDGLFADFDGYQTVLSAENGICAHDTVYLEPSVWFALQRWHRDTIEPLYKQVNEG